MPTPLLTPVCVFNFEISPERDSKHSIRNSDFFALIHTHNSHLRRTTYPSILRDKPESKPRPGSTGVDLSRKSQKRKTSRNRPHEIYWSQDIFIYYTYI